MAQCADLRCELLADRVAAAAAPPARTLDLLLDLVRARAKAGDVAGTATLLSGVAPLFVRTAPTAYDRDLRRDAVRLDTQLSALLDPLVRCAGPDRCPSCRAGEPCPLDMWRLALATSALAGNVEKMARQFFMTTPSSRRKQPYFTMRESGHIALADATLRLAHRYWRDTGQPTRADLIADLAWLAGCRDPEIAEAQAAALAAGGRGPDLEAAALVCATALPLRNESTDEAWRLLAIREAQILGQIERRRVRYSDNFDEDGNPIPFRRHEAERPHRVRPTRFLRTSSAPDATTD